MNNSHAESQTDSKSPKPIAPKIEEILAKNKSLILATVNAEGAPNASYAPFARVGNKFYILVSFMSVHTKNLRDQGKASAMFIEDEADTKQMYARTRLTLTVTSKAIERGTEEWNNGIAKLQDIHGKILDVLVGMEDFIMVELTTQKGSYVNGFGSAYFVDENIEVIQHRNEVGHGTKSN